MEDVRINSDRLWASLMEMARSRRYAGDLPPRTIPLFKLDSTSREVLI